MLRDAAWGAILLGWALCALEIWKDGYEDMSVMGAWLCIGAAASACTGTFMLFLFLRSRPPAGG